MAEDTQVRIKYIPTGVVFKLPKKDAIETMKTDRGNFEAVDFKFPEEKEVVETTTFEQVVESETEKKYDREAREKELNKLKVTELIAFCDKYKIAYNKNDKKADLIEKIIEKETKTEAAEGTPATTETKTEEQVVEE